ncbi:hypothetical protein HHK36_003301 [Tetracentron sinense]|uniref:Uncharacterized protein n=1 Tax=Tetracentron sinense TaxID=13715 RepID=A0A835DS26_TETSI|nr:hypothetical protein HHK36_003301 [Tetracentron sinense]
MKTMEDLVIKRVIGDETRAVDMNASMEAVENLLRYRFKDRRLLEEALTHSSHPGSASFERLEFVGDAALGLAVTNFLFLSYPDLDPGQLSLLRAANISTEKLARVAVRHRLHSYVRHKSSPLLAKVEEFVLAVQDEDDLVPYGGVLKAPKFLADIVESIAAAVYVDCEFDLKSLWMIFRGLLEPIVTLEILQKEPQPVTLLFDMLNRKGKQIDIKHWRNGQKNIASVYVDGKFIASGSSNQRETAKIHAAREALQKLSQLEAKDTKADEVCSVINGVDENETAKQKLSALCGKKRWAKPIYRCEFSPY